MSTQPATPPAQSAVERRKAPTGATPKADDRRPAEPFLSGKLPSGMPFDVTTQGIMREFTNGRFDKNGYSEIDHGVWMRQCAEGGVVGTCRRCGAALYPRRPIEHHGTFDYEAYCRRSIESTFDPVTRVRTVTGCGWEMTAPRGKVMLASSARSERRSALSKKAGVRNGATDPATQQSSF